MVSTRVGLMRNEVAGQSGGPIETPKIGVKSATEFQIFQLDSDTSQIGSETQAGTHSYLERALRFLRIQPVG